MAGQTTVVADFVVGYLQQASALQTTHFTAGQWTHSGAGIERLTFASQAFLSVAPFVGTPTLRGVPPHSTEKKKGTTMDAWAHKQVQEHLDRTGITVDDQTRNLMAQMVSEYYSSGYVIGMTNGKIDNKVAL